MSHQTQSLFRKGAVATIAAIAVFCAALLPANASPGQTVTSVANGVTVDSLVALLIGDATPYSNVVVTGSNDAIGYFAGFSDLGAESGVVLSTGNVREVNSAVPGPNTEGNTSGRMANIRDMDLEAVLTARGTPGVTHDAISLEFDFVPTTSALLFSYIFGSEEYIEWVNSRYNDVFGLFVNGVNCATIGAGNVPISVNNVNHLVNTQYYRDNPPGSGLIDTGFDGVTTVLTCQVDVTPGTTNHVKFAIADVSDQIYDSGVFIVAGSFITTKIPDPDNSTITAAPVVVAADGTTQITVTVQLYDELGDPITTGGSNVTISTDFGAISGVVDNLDGTYTATVTSTTPGDAVFTYTVNNRPGVDTAAGAFVAGPSPALSTITATPPVVYADGKSEIFVTVQLYDTAGDPITTGGATVTIASSLGTIGAVVDNLNGTYTTTVTSLTAGDTTFTYTVNGLTGVNTAEGTFLVAPQVIVVLTGGAVAGQGLPGLLLGGALILLGAGWAIRRLQVKSA